MNYLILSFCRFGLFLHYWDAIINTTVCIKTYIHTYMNMYLCMHMHIFIWYIYVYFFALSFAYFLKNFLVASEGKHLCILIQKCQIALQNQQSQFITWPTKLGNGNPLQYSCLENPRDGGAWWAAVSGVAQSQTWLKRLSSSSRIHKTHTQCNHDLYNLC